MATLTDSKTETAVDMALIKNQPGGMRLFVFPNDPEEIYPLLIADQKLQRRLENHPENYIEALTSVPFPRYLLNTMIVTFVSMFGMLLSCSFVACGFYRFRAPGLNVLFLVLLPQARPSLVAILIFFLSQRIFTQGVVISGIKG